MTDQLDSNLNWSQFRLGSFGFGGLTYQVPANLSYYQTTLDLQQLLGFNVELTATIDERTGVATWIFATVDPTTGQTPLNPLLGLLPPDGASGLGEGFVNYTITANQAAATGTVIGAQATVIFNTQPPMNTPRIFNTIDSGAGLVSSVTALPANVTNNSVNVSWNGTDAVNGSAVQDFSIFVSDNGGAYTPWLQDTTLTDATYVGEAGHTYSFYSVAADNAGNIQATLALAQAVVSFAATVPPTGGPTSPPPSGGATSPPPSGGATSPPPSGGATSPPPSGGATSPPPSGGATSPPPSGGATSPPPSGGATSPPPSGGATSPPPSGGATSPPPSGGATSPPPSGGATSPPPAGNSGNPTNGGSTTQTTTGNSGSSTNGSSSTQTTSGNTGSSTNGGSTAPTTSGNQIVSTTPVVPVVQIDSEPTPGAPFTNPNAPAAIVAEAPRSTNLAASTDSGLTASATSGSTGSTLASANRSTAAGQSSLLATFSAFFSTVVSASGPTGTFETGTISLQASVSPNGSGPVTGSVSTAQVGGGDIRAAYTFAQAIQDVNAVFQETIQDSETTVGDAIRKTINQAQGAIGQPPPMKVKPDDQDPEEEEPSQVLLDVQPSDLQCCDAAFANLDDLLVSVPRLGLENQEKEDEQFGQLPWDVQQPEMRHRDAAFSGWNALLGAALFVAGGQATAWREQLEPSRRQSDKKKGNDKLLLP